MPNLKSSLIKAYSYDEDTRDLTVTYHSGRTFIHPAVPPEKVDAMETAPSAGSYFLQHIRDMYTGTRV